MAPRVKSSAPRKHWNQKLSDAQVRLIRKLRHRHMPKALGKLFRVHPSHICNICTYTRRGGVR